MSELASTERILLVSPSPSIRRLLGEGLRQRGVTTMEAVDAVDAIRIMAPELPSEIVVASRLGAERGLEFVRTLGRLEKTARIPVVLLVCDHEGVVEAKRARLRATANSLVASNDIESLVEQILHPDVPAVPVLAVSDAPATEPGRVRTLDAAYEYFDELLDLVTSGRLPGPIVPDLLQRVHGLFAKPDIDARTVVSFVGQHPALAARLLFLSNSAFYGATSRIVTIEDAVTRLGVEPVKDVLHAVAALEYLQGAAGGLRTAITEALGRGYFVGMVSQTLAEDAQFSGSGSAFTLGLFHNIGQSFLLYAAAMLHEKQQREPAPIAALLTMAQHNGLLANRLVRRAMHLPVEVEAIHGEPELRSDDAPADPGLVRFVHHAMWTADRALRPNPGLLHLDAEAQLLDLPPAAIPRLNRLAKELRPMVQSYTKG